MANVKDGNLMQRFAQITAPETEYVTQIFDNTGEKVDVKFRIVHWSPTRVYKMIPKIGKIIGVPAAMMLGNEASSFQESLAAALLQMFQTFEEQDIMEFIHEMLSSVYFNGKAVTDDLDKTFLNHPQLILQLVIKVLEVTYSPFTQLDFMQGMKTMGMVVGMQKVTSPQA